ncbi:MAG: GNAT family N-acetyltransferase [Azoarcus sp.]|jgi:GNAT superfamily N-acetyltransferase|nr:GNAT family N-acetyltransferase [Azoarcus sp.]
MALSFLSVTDDAGALVAGEWLPRAENVHRQLRGDLPPGHDPYLAVMTKVCAGGARLCLAAEGEHVKGLALWRIVDNTHEGRRLYVDDLVTDAACRSQGVGKALIGWLERRARELGCDVLALDSGVQRAGAHRFYFRESFAISSFCFRKELI